jgi:phospholipid/cholesterol/gamma-HCH transport system substrate-binding protein
VNKKVDILVGLFVVAAIFAFGFLAYKASDFGGSNLKKPYIVYASFDNIGSLKVRSPVAIGGVKIGEVFKIDLDKNFTPKATLKISSKFNNIPKDSVARILTAGLLGSNYISVEPGFGDDELVLSNNDEISETHGAIILENLIGQFLFSLNKDEKDDLLIEKQDDLSNSMKESQSINVKSMGSENDE